MWEIHGGVKTQQINKLEWLSFFCKIQTKIFWRIVSGYTCNHGSLRIGNEMLHPLERVLWERLQRDRCLKHEWKNPMHLTLAGGSLWRKQMSDCGNKRALVEHVILYFQRGRRKECPKHGQETQRLVPYSQGTMVTCVTWDVHTFFALNNSVYAICEGCIVHATVCSQCVCGVRYSAAAH